MLYRIGSSEKRSALFSSAKVAGRDDTLNSFALNLVAICHKIGYIRQEMVGRMEKVVKNEEVML